jgi:hypothetical protein
MWLSKLRKSVPGFCRVEQLDSAVELETVPKLSVCATDAQGKADRIRPMAHTSVVDSFGVMGKLLVDFVAVRARNHTSQEREIQAISCKLLRRPACFSRHLRREVL